MRMRGCRRLPEEPVAHFTRKLFEASAFQPCPCSAFPSLDAGGLERDGMRGAELVNEIDIGGDLGFRPDAVIHNTGSQAQRALVPQGSERAQQRSGIGTAGDCDQKRAASRNGRLCQRGAD